MATATTGGDDPSDSQEAMGASGQAPCRRHGFELLDHEPSSVDEFLVVKAAIKKCILRKARNLALRVPADCYPCTRSLEVLMECRRLVTGNGGRLVVIHDNEGNARLLSFLSNVPVCRCAHGGMPWPGASRRPAA